MIYIDFTVKLTIYCIYRIQNLSELIPSIKKKKVPSEKKKEKKIMGST